MGMDDSGLLFPGSTLQPVQRQCPVARILQPFHDFFRLETSIAWFQFTIEHIDYLFGGAWFSDLVQRSSDGFAKPSFRIWYVSHFLYRPRGASSLASRVLDVTLGSANSNTSSQDLGALLFASKEHMVSFLNHSEAVDART
jgi:hypothetical protein